MQNILSQDKRRIFLGTILIDFGLIFLIISLIYVNLYFASKLFNFDLNYLLIFLIISIILVIISFFDLIDGLKNIKMYVLNNNQIVEYVDQNVVKTYPVFNLKHLTIHESFLDKIFNNESLNINDEFDMHYLRKNEDLNNFIGNLNNINSSNNISNYKF